MKKKIILAAAAILCGSFLLWLFYEYMIRTRNAVEELVRERKMINVLIAGRNRAHENKYSFYAIVSINPENSAIGITCIPPAYRIYLGGNREHVRRIDEMPIGDFSLIRETLQADLKISVPFYIAMYASDVRRVVDLLEGIDLFVLDQVKDMTALHFGLNYFDGDKAVRYINDVETGSIYVKYDRILDILLTLYQDRETKKSFFTLPFITEAFRTIRTNLLPQEVYRIGQIAYKEGNVLTCTLPGSFENNLYVVDDIAFKLYEKDFLRSLVIAQELESQAKIKILNGTDVPGLARKKRNDYNRDGLNVVEFGSSPYPFMDESIIINRKGNTAVVKKVSELTGISRIHHIIDNTQLTNTLIIIGKDQKHEATGDGNEQ